MSSVHAPRPQRPHRRHERAAPQRWRRIHGSRRSAARFFSPVQPSHNNEIIRPAHAELRSVDHPIALWSCHLRTGVAHRVAPHRPQQQQGERAHAVSDVRSGLGVRVGGLCTRTHLRTGSSVHVRAVSQQQVHSLGAPLLRRQHQRRSPVLWRTMKGGWDRAVASGSQVETATRAYRVNGVHVRTEPDQALHRQQVAVLRCDRQGRRPALRKRAAQRTSVKGALQCRQAASAAAVAAICRTSALAFTSAPFAARSCTMAASPSSAAASRGVTPCCGTAKDRMCTLW